MINKKIFHKIQAGKNKALQLNGYGVFIAGPSKTADIEQIFVIGAHDPKSLTII